MTKKLYISVICGGQSTEHEISIQSAKNIVAALDLNKYIISIVFIDQQGKWYLIDKYKEFLNCNLEDLIKVGLALPITITLGELKQSWQFLNSNKRHLVDCIFPMVHGTQGEDGTLQGFFELLNLPYVGADMQSSAICMQKDITKSLLRAAGIPVVDWYALRSSDGWKGLYQKLATAWHTLELFVKAVSLGSSIGTLSIKTEHEFKKAIEMVFTYDDRLIIEPRILGREIECAVLGNGHPKASLPGEIILHHEYYSYEAKYIDSNGATTLTSIDLPKIIIKRIQQMAIDAFKVVHCSGMARVDFFISNKNKLMINEINTIPGFTNISMYPKMWEATGLPCRDLLDQLIALALKRHREQKKLIRYYQVYPSHSHDLIRDSIQQRTVS
ncbi:D-alanine--D-alanine ligase family protein [Coxiella endosymbiont of Amblyomma nuttalli]|uniref:D-alanine--D-alanine ligase family protein n=1 Tax=Coxiella endosymbiont of Amblyomma nuttalli TaxID=2749996 RepID=UPI001BA782F5|nr:D-alanine--D-alanine ligase family protein [Coxiella endosymbiont of Amblyomma nuttalli]QTS83863.1 D-alanine--D-alanine ligase [Coxiella endosymbiont of Amblyomma nuttalli]